MGKILVEKISYTEVTRNITQAEYNQTQEEYILSRSPEKYDQPPDQSSDVSGSRRTPSVYILFL